MTKLSRTVIACISATMMLAGAVSSARANSFFYFLDNNTLADANGGPSLVSYGGTLSNGYHFGVNEGLSLSGTGADCLAIAGCRKRRVRVAPRPTRASRLVTQNELGPRRCSTRIAG